MGRIRRWAVSMPASHVWLILLTMLVAGPTSGFATWWLMTQPPVIVFDAYEEDAYATAGGQLDLIARKIDNRPCFTVVARWLWRLDPTDPLPDTDPLKRREWREIATAPHSPPSVGRATNYRLVVPLPLGIEPGDWRYQGQALDTCSSPLGAGPRFSREFPVRIDAVQAGSAE